MNQRYLLLRRAAIALLLLPFPGAFVPSRAAASTMYALSFNPVADTFVKQLFPDKNYGQLDYLRVDGFPIVHSYLRFSVRGLGGAHIVQAQFQIFAESDSGVGIAVHPVADDTWDESTLMYSTSPIIGPALSASSRFTRGNWVPLDVTSYITGEGDWDFGVTTGGITSIRLASRESGVDTAPRLILVLQAPDAPTPTATSSPAPTDSPTATASLMPPAPDTPTETLAPLPTDTPVPTAGAVDTPTATFPAATNTPTSAPTAVSTDTPSPSSTPASTATPTSQPASGPINHIFVVLMENKSYGEVWNTNSAPYITQLGNSYARTTNYHAVTHPSLPNYLDLIGGSNYGITTDCLPSSTCHISAPNLADSLEAAGRSWKAYEESMPSPCYLTTSGTYAPKHDPFVYFDDIRNDPTRCSSHVVSYSALASDLASAATTPNFAFITPNLCDDMHDCSVSTGDTWLQNNLPQILSSPACTSEACLLVLTWDEDDNSAGNHVLTIFAGSAAKQAGATSSVSYTHFSLLKTIESIFDLPALTGNDAGASPMTDLLR